MGKIIKIILFLSIFAIIWACRIDNNSNLPLLPVSLQFKQKEIRTIQARLERPTSSERKTCHISIASTNTNLLEIYAFRYNVGCNHCGYSPAFYGVSFTVGAVGAGQADLIITTEMTVKDTLRQFADTIHVSIL